MLAKRINYSRGHICKVENGDKAPNETLARLCDAALRANGALASHPGAKRMARAGRSPRTRPAADVVSVAGQAVWDTGVGAIEGRLQSVLDALAAVPGSAAGWVDPTLVHRYRATFAEYRQRGQLQGPVDLIPTLRAELRSLTALAQRAEPEVRGELYRLSARFAEYLGWMTQELGQTAVTRQLTDHATDLARLGGDDMAAFRLVRLADLALDERDPDRLIALSGRALRAAGDPRVGGLAAQRLAQGYALANDINACLRALDLARELLQRVPEPAGAALPAVGSGTVVDHVTMASGWCLFDLAKPKEAAAILAVEVGRLPADAHRSQARYGARLARCYAEMGELEQACATAEPILRRLPSLASASIGVDVAGLAATLRRHPGHPAVRSLGPLLAENHRRR